MESDFRVRRTDGEAEVPVMHLTSRSGIDTPLLNDQSPYQSDSEHSESDEPDWVVIYSSRHSDPTGDFLRIQVQFEVNFEELQAKRYRENREGANYAAKYFMNLRDTLHRRFNFAPGAFTWTGIYSGRQNTNVGTIGVRIEVNYLLYFSPVFGHSTMLN